MSTSLLLRTSRYIARRTVQRPLALRGPVGVVSFTFDDAPASACDIGASMLEQHGARGTFYVAGGLTDRMEEGMPCHTLPQLQQLLQDGHEVGCHSYSHVRCDTLAPAALTAELDRNAAFLAGLGLNPAQLDFAYPFGAYAWGAKRLCASRFVSSRITGGGTHLGTADLNALKTHRLYHRPVDAETYETVLAQTARHKGWLVVNTHDVQDNPSPFGYTPLALAQAVSAALAAGCKVLPVRAAIDYWRSAA